MLSEFKKLRSIWSQSSLPARAILIVSTFFTVTSVTSLSDAVFQWKGFILDGLTFYRDCFIGTIREVAIYFGIALTADAVDVVILSAIWFIAIVRTNVVAGKIDNALFLTLIYFALIVSQVHVLNGVTANRYSWILLLGIFVMYMLYPRALPKRLTPKQSFAYYLPMIASILVILILGAINSGLHRTS